MRKSTWTILPALLAVLLLAVACGGNDKKDEAGVSNQDGTDSAQSHDSASGGGFSGLLVADPRAALGKSAEALTERVESMQGTFAFSFSADGMAMDLSGGYAFRAPDAMHMTADISVSGDDFMAGLGDLGFEVLMRGDSLYMNTPFFGGWVVMTLEDLGADAGSYQKLLDNHAPFDYAAFIDSLGGVDNVGEEKIDGQTYTHLRLETDWAAALATLSDAFSDNGLDTTSIPAGVLEGPVTFDLWMDAGSGLPRRLQASGSMDVPPATDSDGATINGPLEFDMRFDFEKYNGDVDIPEAPKDAKSFLEIFSDGGIFGDSSGD